MPITPFIGVRISWLIVARNSLFARLAASAASRACRSSSSARLCAVMSLYVDTKPPPRMGLSWISMIRPLGSSRSIRRGWNWRAWAIRSAVCAAGSPGPNSPRSATMRTNSSRGRPTHAKSGANPMMSSARLFQAARRSSPSKANRPCPMLSSVVSSSADFCATSASRRRVTSSSRAFSSAAAAWPASVVSRRASASVWVWTPLCELSSTPYTPSRRMTGAAM